MIKKVEIDEVTDISLLNDLLEQCHKDQRQMYIEKRAAYMQFTLGSPIGYKKWVELTHEVNILQLEARILRNRINQLTK